MEQCVYYFRETLVGSNELSLSFWFVSNICKHNKLCYKKKKKENQPLQHSTFHHHWGEWEGPPLLQQVSLVAALVLYQETTVSDVTYGKREALAYTS